MLFRMGAIYAVPVLPQFRVLNSILGFACFFNSYFKQLPGSKFRITPS